MPRLQKTVDINAADIGTALHRHDILLDHACNLEIAREAVSGGLHDAILLNR